VSTSEPIVTIAWWHAREGALDKVLGLTSELRVKSLAEPGCLDYEVLASVDDHRALVLIERYRDSAALEYHRLSDHYRELVVEQIVPLLESRRVELLGLRE
jgi:quinol monooxygenase YgiN